MHHARTPGGARPPRSRLRGTRIATALALTALAVLATTSSSSAYVFIPEIDNDVHPFVDARTASVPPSAEQLAAVDRLGATVRWNRFGTPQSLTKYRGYLATGVRAGDAASAARAFLDANATLFALGAASDLELVRSLARGPQ